MMDYWNKLNQREQGAVAFCVVFLFLYLIYSLIYAPLDHAVDRQLASIKEKRSLLIWMEHARSQTMHQKKPSPVASSKFLSVVSDALTPSPLNSFAHQLQQTGEGELQLSFDEVPYNACVAWLFSMHEKYAFLIKQLSMKQTKTPGLVEASFQIGVLDEPR